MYSYCWKMGGHSTSGCWSVPCLYNLIKRREGSWPQVKEALALQRDLFPSDSEGFYGSGWRSPQKRGFSWGKYLRGQISRCLHLMADDQDRICVEDVEDDDDDFTEDEGELYDVNKEPD
ncbi:uncharacterized protein LOC110691774 isoform X2 [Chenopodium quinoa]|uniref:uncharacterized protein LOC110691774 isoform X2 n=1 Tax=Chenopodium quinoa TaxID=63459 RepID=UPI000B7894E4|nr:uncharacterized protein LOC110691774 isoform X2 [Chenopodium quinoa]